MNFDTLAQRLRELAFLNRGVHDRHRATSGRDKEARVRYEGGIVSFVET